MVIDVCLRAPEKKKIEKFSFYAFGRVFRLFLLDLFY